MWISVNSTQPSEFYKQITHYLEKYSLQEETMDSIFQHGEQPLHQHNLLVHTEGWGFLKEYH